MKAQQVIYLLILLFPLSLLSQQEEDRKKYYENLVQFTGIVVTGDSLRPVPYTNILDKTRHRGTISDYYGYFSFVALRGDTIEFSSVGFKKSYFYIPDTISAPRYTVFQVMTEDTVYLSETVIYPWPSKEMFKEAFLALDVPDDDMEIARRNLESRKIMMLAEAMPMDGAMNYRNYIDQTISKYYSYGQLVPYYGIFDVVAWAKFIEAWRAGKFKKKTKP
jgi:hypothetical protein